jgi:hypothetical protein
MNDAAVFVERAARWGVRLTTEQAEILSVQALNVVEIGEIHGVPDNELLYAGLGDQGRVGERAPATKVETVAFTLNGLVGILRSAIYVQLQQNKRNFWAFFERFRPVMRSFDDPRPMKVDEYHLRQYRAASLLPTLGAVLKQLVPNPNARIALSYEQAHGALRFDHEGFITQQGLEDLTHSRENQFRHELIHSELITHGKIFKDAQQVYQEAGVNEKGTLTVWDQKAGYHDLALHVRHLIASGQKYLPVLQREQELRYGLEEYIAFLVSERGQGVDVTAELMLAYELEANLGFANPNSPPTIELVLLPPELRGELDQSFRESGAYNFRYVVEYFDEWARFHQYNRVIYVSDWRDLTMAGKLVGVFQITNVNAFVVGNATMRLATYALIRKQA